MHILIQIFTSYSLVRKSSFPYQGKVVGLPDRKGSLPILSCFCVFQLKWLQKTTPSRFAIHPSLKKHILIHIFFYAKCLKELTRTTGEWPQKGAEIAKHRARKPFNQSIHLKYIGCGIPLLRLLRLFAAINSASFILSDLCRRICLKKEGS